MLRLDASHMDVQLWTRLDWHRLSRGNQRMCIESVSQRRDLHRCVEQVPMPVPSRFHWTSLSNRIESMFEYVLSEQRSVSTIDHFQDQIRSSSGTCVNQIVSHSCLCPQGWTGKLCEVNINECAQALSCHPNATCIDLPGSYQCVCPPWLTGPNCLTAVDQCQPSTCHHDGVCVNNYGTLPTCHCQPGFTGHYCEVSVENILREQNDDDRLHRLGKHRWLSNIAVRQQWYLHWPSEQFCLPLSIGLHWFTMSSSSESMHQLLLPERWHLPRCIWQCWSQRFHVPLSTSFHRSALRTNPQPVHQFPLRLWQLYSDESIVQMPMQSRLYGSELWNDDRSMHTRRMRGEWYLYQFGCEV